jgi:HAD superfamily hydrolase (TIGR01490 family)
MERMREQVSGLVAGWDVELVRAVVAATLERRIAPLVHPEAVALITRHREAGRDVVLVSASGSELVEPIGAMLGVDRVIATRMVERDGRWTGEIAFYAYGENKAVALRAAAAEHGYDLDGSYAYSDSVTDLPMLCAVGHPCAVNPDRALRREAAVRGWPVLDVAPLGAGGVLASVPRQRRLLRDAVRRREQG